MTDNNLELSNMLQKLFLQHRSLYADWRECIKVFIQTGRDLHIARKSGDKPAIERLGAITSREGPRQMKLQDDILDIEFQMRNALDRLASINGSTDPCLIHMTAPLCIACGKIHEPEYPHADTPQFRRRTERTAKRTYDISDTWAHCTGIMLESAILANDKNTSNLGPSDTLVVHTSKQTARDNSKNRISRMTSSTDEQQTDTQGEKDD